MFSAHLLRAPAYRRPSVRRSLRRAKNVGHAASARYIQTWKLASPAGGVVVIGMVGGYAAAGRLARTTRG